MASFIVLLGPPGVGKGTQAKILAAKTHLVHISTGDLFRENMKNETELGKEARAFMDKGELVPDDLTVAMVRERLSRQDCEAGAILDGFPRTPHQAEALHATLREHAADVALVAFITAAPEVLIDRAAGRWTCRAKGHIFHEKHNPPKVSGKCDVDGSELFQRADDSPETVARRIQVYMEQTSPLVEYYRRRGTLVEFDGTQPIDAVTSALLEALGKRQ